MRIIKSAFMVIFISSFVACGQSTKGVKDAKGLPVGSTAPLFSAMDADSNAFRLSDALAAGPVVLIFYRGYWCPVCNRHLGQIEDSLRLITGKGVTVVAISPEKPEYLDKMREKTGASFRLLYDEGYKIADAFDVTFTLKNSDLVIYNTLLKANLKGTHTDDTQRLPIPATYLLNTQGLITWRQFDPDYKKRSSVSDILKAIDNLK